MPSTTSLKKQIPRSIIFLMLLFSSSQLYAAAFLLGPMLGHVDDHSAKIWCALDEKGEIELKISEDPEFKNARIISQKDFELGSISIDGLKADTLYYYEIGAYKYSKSITSQLKTMKAAGEGRKLRFLFSSCSGNSGYREDRSWADIAQLKGIDLILMLGDNHYANTTEPDLITKHYFSHRAIGGFRQANC